jgi:hypothetical protein
MSKAQLYSLHLICIVGKEKFPVLFLWGDKDKTVPLHCGQEALKYIPRAGVHRYVVNLWFVRVGSLQGFRTCSFHGTPRGGTR